MNSNSKFIFGTCEAMCPPEEIAMRRKNRLLHYFEQKTLVKEFSRSAADKKEAKSSELRTFGALQTTINYLINK